MTPAVTRALSALAEGRLIYVFTANSNSNGKHIYQKDNTVSHSTLNALLDNGYLQIEASRVPTPEDADLMRGNQYAITNNWHSDIRQYTRDYNPRFWRRVIIYRISERGWLELNG